MIDEYKCLNKQRIFEYFVKFITYILTLHVYEFQSIVIRPNRFYRFISIFTGIFEFLADLCLCLGAWKASVMLHNYMTANVFRNPMRFFDATPTGRILSRFSSDVEVVDKLSQQISDTVYCLMDVRAIFVIYTFFFTLSAVLIWLLSKLYGLYCNN